MYHPHMESNNINYLMNKLRGTSIVSQVFGFRRLAVFGRFLIKNILGTIPSGSI